MPEAVVQSVLKQIEKGKTPAICKKRKVTGRKCGEMIASIVENKMKKRRALKGGKDVKRGDVQSVLLPKAKFATEDEAVTYAKAHGWYKGTVRGTDNFWRFRQFPPGDHKFKTKELEGGIKMVVVEGGAVPTHASYTQAPLKEKPKVDSDDGIWLKIMDWDAKLLDSDTGAPYQVSEEALVAAMGAWASPLYQDVRANIDHRRETALSREEFDFLEARYEWGDGLFVKVMPTDAELRLALLDGTVRPSPEFELRVYDDGEDVVWPTGLGLMWEGEPTSAGSGVAEPSENALELKGGKNMSKDEEMDTDNDAGDKTPKKVTIDIAGAENVKAALDALKQQADKQKADYDATIAAQKAELETLKAFKKTAEDNNVAIEKARRAELLKKLPDDYPDKDASVKQLERDVYLLDKAKKDVEANRIKGPNFREKDALGAEWNEDTYKKGRELEKKILGQNSPGMVAFTPFEMAQSEAAAEQAAKAAAAAANPEKK